jgi:hypothetical protein
VSGRDRYLGATAAGVLAAWAFASTASAHGQLLLAAIRAQDRALDSSPALKVLEQKGNTLLTSAGIQRYARDAGIAAGEFNRAADAVADANAMPGQADGQRVWVESARKESGGFSEIQAGTRLVTQGRVKAGNHKLALGHAKIEAGDKLGLRAGRLLGLHPGD